MSPEQLDEIEKRWAGYLEKNEVERRFLFDRWWDKRDFWDMTKALREAWKERDEARAEAKRLRDLIDTVIRNCMECYDKRECQSCAWLRQGTEAKP